MEDIPLCKMDILDKLEHVLAMIAFLNHTYNTSDSANDVEMGNKEKMGGMLFFNHLEDTLKNIMKQIQSVID